MTSTPVDAQRLLAEISWIRGLARQLATDGHDADDLVQDTLAVALHRAPPLDDPARLRAWLGGVLRNVRWAGSRREGHRAQRERAVSRAERTPSAAELVERASVHRALVGELLELEEPYRTTLLLRFFHGLSNEEIARRTRTGSSTVASRIHRALGVLRRRLERRHGRDVTTWLAALLPPPPAGDGAPGTGGGAGTSASPLSPIGSLTGLSSIGSLTGPGTSTVIAMSLQAKLLLVFGVLATALLLVRAATDDRAVATATPRHEVALAAATVDPRPPSDEPSAREAMSSPGTPGVRELAPAPRGTKEPPAADERLVVRGRVIDLAGRGVEGVTLAARSEVGSKLGGPFRLRGFAQEVGESGPPESGSNGRFEVEVPPSARGTGTLVAEDERYVTVLAAGLPMAGATSVPVSGDTELTIVVGWRIPLMGVVVDTNGEPVAGATVFVDPLDLSDLGLVLDHSVPIEFHATTDAAGRFEIADAAELPKARWGARASGFETRWDPLPPGGTSHARLVLERRRADARRIVGRVLLPDGRPAEGAHVSFGALAEETDSHGRFVLPVVDDPALEALLVSEPLRLWAVMEGFAPASRTLPTLEDGRRDGWPEDLVLRLGHALDRVLAGRVVAPDGSPLAGVSVDLVDPTPFGRIPWEGSGMSSADRSVEEPLRTATDAEGSFRFEGLVDRPYRLVALDTETMLSTIGGPFEVGDRGIRLTLDTAALGTVAGVVVDSRGLPLPEVRVSVSYATSRVVTFGKYAVTDAEGRFRIEGSATRDITLGLAGDSILPELGRALPVGSDVEELTLVAQLRCHVRFEWGRHAGRSRALEVVDVDGGAIPVHHIRGRSWGLEPLVAIEGERSEVYVLPDDAAWVRVVEGEREVERAPVTLVPGEVKVVQL